MLKIKVIAKYINYKLCDYIKEISPNLTISSIKRSINKGDIKINNKKVFDNYLLQVNDEINVYINIKKPSDKYLKTSIKIPIFYEDENIIIFDKPKNISCQENENEKINTLNNYLRKYCFYNKIWDGINLENEPSLIHRLDQNTMGLVIAAKNKEVARKLNKAINDEINKSYLTVIYDKPTKKDGVLIDFINKDQSQNNKMIVSKKPLNSYSSEIRTKFNCIYSNHDYSILNIQLLTGKKHQIRAHLAFYKMYIVGDSKYGIKNPKLHLNSQLLIANQIVFQLKDKTLSYLNDKEFTKYKNPIEILKYLK